jgi:lipid-binding SYLF domain-containing protein
MKLGRLTSGFTAILLAFPGLVLAEKAQERLQDATTVLEEVMATPEKGIPQDLLDKAHCVVIVPGVKKLALGIGGKYGRGFTICRGASDRGWGAPAAVRMEGGSIGWQIGGSESDIVLLVMNESGMKKLLESKFTLDADATAAAGPVGRTAQASTDAKMTAEILSYSRARGLFAGIAIGGATLRQDLDENKELYGEPLTNKVILTGGVKPPAAAEKLRADLTKYSRVEEGQRARQKP